MEGVREYWVNVYSDYNTGAYYSLAGRGIEKYGLRKIMNNQNPKLLLMDFYLKLLAIPHNDKFRIKNQPLYSEVLTSLAIELGTDQQTVQDIFERMVEEDAK